MSKWPDSGAAEQLSDELAGRPKAGAWLLREVRVARVARPAADCQEQP